MQRLLVESPWKDLENVHRIQNFSPCRFTTFIPVIVVFVFYAKLEIKQFKSKYNEKIRDYYLDKQREYFYELRNKYKIRLFAYSVRNIEIF